MMSHLVIHLRLSSKRLNVKHSIWKVYTIVNTTEISPRSLTITLRSIQGDVSYRSMKLDCRVQILSVTVGISPKGSSGTRFHIGLTMQDPVHKVTLQAFPKAWVQVRAGSYVHQSYTNLNALLLFVALEGSNELNTLPASCTLWLRYSLLHLKAHRYACNQFITTSRRQSIRAPAIIYSVTRSLTYFFFKSNWFLKMYLAKIKC